MIEAGEFAGYPRPADPQVRWDAVDEPVEYTPPARPRRRRQGPDSHGHPTFKDKLFTELFPGRTTVPKTLIFAKDDSHADDIVQMVREVFGKGNEFATKITYRTNDGKAEDLLQAFRNSMYPRIVVTVDMIATGTDVRPLECLLFMRIGQEPHLLRADDWTRSPGHRRHRVPGGHRRRQAQGPLHRR